ncbi:MAG: hypothetical protein FH758_02870 [Firmicutes bacterium]|nr:hypothetical protein [Bacillota bacterium]
MEGAYSIIETPTLEKIAGMLEQEGMDSSEVFKARIDITYYVNFLRSFLNKDLSESNELDLEEFRKYIKKDINFPELDARRYNHAKLAMEKLKEIKNK